MAEFHNWYQLFHVLQNFHYTQRITRNEKIIFDKPGKDDITIQKSNRIHEAQVTAICQEIGITHKEFDEAFANNGSEQGFEVLIHKMVVGIADSYLEDCEGKFGISMPLVRETISNPDSHQVLCTLESFEFYFVKLIPQSKDCLLVHVVRYMTLQDIKIKFVFRISTELVEEAKSIEPNNLLRVLAERTGVPIRIGNERKNFFWNEDILIEEPGRSSASWERIPAHTYTSMIANMRIENDQQFSRVHVGYIIDLDKYQGLLE